MSSLPAVYAETIVLKSGVQIQEAIVQSDDKSFQVDFYGTKLTYYWDDVESVNGQSVSAFRSSQSPVAQSIPVPLEQSVPVPLEQSIPVSLEQSVPVAPEQSVPVPQSSQSSEESHTVDWYVRRGQLAAQQERYAEAIKEYSQAIRQLWSSGGSEVNLNIYFLRAAAYEMDHQLQKAVNDYREAAQVHSGFARLYFMRLNAQGFRAGAIAEMARNADAAIASSGRSAAVLKKLSFALLLKGDFEAAAKVYQEAVGLQKEDLPLRAEYAFFLLLKGDFQGCIRESDAVLAQNPGLAIAYLNRGDARSFIGEYEPALKDYIQAISLDPELMYAYSARAYLVDFLDEGAASSRAMAALDEALVRQPRNVFLLLRRAKRYQNAGDFAGALRDCDLAIVSEPDYFFPYTVKGKVYTAQKEWDQALGVFRKSLELYPEAGDTYAARAAVYYEIKEYQKSLNDLDKASEFGFGVEPELLAAVKKAVGE